MKVIDIIGTGFIILIFLLASCEKDHEKGAISDIEGQGYETVKIGDQWWMAENLKTTKYNDYEDLPNVTGNTEWNSLTTSAYCWYNNDETENKNRYGALYNWFAVSSGRLCPIGWHVPNSSDWTKLITNLGGIDKVAVKMKATGTNWPSPNTDATNESGFTAIPAGYRNYDGSFMGHGINANWFSSTEESERDALMFTIFIANTATAFGGYWKTAGFSIRCIKD